MVLSFFQRPRRPTSREAVADVAPAEPFPEPNAGIGNFDAPPEPDFALAAAERELLLQMDADVEQGELEMPHLPSSNLKLLDMTANQDIEVERLEHLLAADVVLAAAILKIANSVMYGGARQVETVRAAVLRIGVRGLRSVLYSLSMKSVIFKSKGLSNAAEEVWRQALSVGVIARALAEALDRDAERMYVLGLLHDVGKVPLLELLRRRAPAGFQFRRPFIGLVFGRHHESVGGRLCRSWNLPEEIVAVAGNHHDESAADPFATSAALARLAHRLDLHLSLGDSAGFGLLVDDVAFDVLGVPAAGRFALLEHVREQYARTLREELFR